MAINTLHTYIYNDHNWSLKGLFRCCEMLHNAAVSFILKRKKNGTGSGTALLCTFKKAQAKAVRGERQRQESQSHVANLATLFLDLAALQTPFGNSKATLDKISDFFYSLGKCWHWQRYILATK